MGRPREADPANNWGVVARTGFEPVISALRGRCPWPLDERATHKANFGGWGSRIRTSAYRSRVCRPTTRRIPTVIAVYQESASRIKAVRGGSTALYTRKPPFLRQAQDRLSLPSSDGGRGKSLDLRSRRGRQSRGPSAHSERHRRGGPSRCPRSRRPRVCSPARQAAAV